MSSRAKGVIVNHGYIQVKIVRNGKTYYKNFGMDCPLSRELATIHAAEKYKEILMGTFGIQKEAQRLKFKEARVVFHKRHYIDYRDEATHQPRSPHSIDNAEGLLRVIGKTFDNYYLDEIRVVDIKNYKTKRLDVDGVSPAAFNREKGMFASVFTQFKRWAAEELIKPVKLPETNPCQGVSTLTEKGRERVPDTWELAAAYDWCMQNDSGLWDGIENALLTALRKGDLISLDGSLTVKGIQQKTGEKFDLPIVLEKPTNLSNYVKRWNALRKALGWLKGQPKHTTWHDLRHWAPTLLGESGFSTKIIQNYGGWNKEETANRYTNIRRKALEPAVQAVRDGIQKIKEQQQL